MLHNNRAQSSAPFEVLVAVVIMGFVLYMGLQAISYFTEEQCKSQIQSEASELKAKVQEAIRGNAVILNFFPPTCFKSVETELRLKHIASKTSCTAICGTPTDQCMLFVYRSEKFSYDLCLENAPTYTSFLTESNCPQSGPGMVAINFLQPCIETSTCELNSNREERVSIPSGVYSIQKQRVGLTVPNLCAYRRVGS